MNAPTPSLRHEAQLEDRKLIVCRRIFAADWPGEVGRQMVLRGDFDEEPEFLRLMAAYEEGQRA